MLPTHTRKEITTEVMLIATTALLHSSRASTSSGRAANLELESHDAVALVPLSIFSPVVRGTRPAGRSYPIPGPTFTLSWAAWLIEAALSLMLSLVSTSVTVFQIERKIGRRASIFSLYVQCGSSHGQCMRRREYIRCK